MTEAMTIMNYCSWVPIRAAWPHEVRLYQIEADLTKNGSGDAGVIDGAVLSPRLEGLRVMLVPTSDVRDHFDHEEYSV